MTNQQKKMCIIGLNLCLLGTALFFAARFGLQTQLIREKLTPQTAKGNRLEIQTPPFKPQPPEPQRIDLAEFRINTSDNINVSTAQPEKLPAAMKLSGTITGNERVARAIIVDESSDDKAGKLYKIGEQVGIFTLSGIERNRVLLTANGKTYLLEGESSLSGPTDTVSHLKPTGKALSTEKTTGIYRTDYPAIQQNRPLSSQPPFSPASQEQVESSWTAGTQLISHLLEDGQFSPWKWNNTVEGLRHTGEDLKITGSDEPLRQGDIIRTINGQVITSPQKAYQVFQKARTQDQISLEVLRGEDLIRFIFK